jgi:ABC-type glycerol-3-phosphate transport system substrate-binding protein
MIVIGIFVVCIIAGVAAFAMFKGGSSSTALPQITIWGTFPKDIFDQYVSKINNTLPQSISIDYVQKSTDQFSKDFIATLARGSGPDAILIPSDMILPHMDKIVPIPYGALPQRDFMDTYIEESYMYLGQQGLYALPFTVDPLIMYWNRDMFNSAGIATSPKYWDEFININKTVTLNAPTVTP